MLCLSCVTLPPIQYTHTYIIIIIYYSRGNGPLVFVSTSYYIMSVCGGARTKDLKPSQVKLLPQNSPHPLIRMSQQSGLQQKHMSEPAQ